MFNKFLTVSVISPILIIIIAVLSYFLIKQIIIKMFKASSKHKVHKKSRTIRNLIINIVKYVVMIVTIFILLGIWGVDTNALLASLGIIGVVAGLAMQDILKDFLAGFSIIIDDEFDVGDNIQIGSFRGDVIDLGLKNTKIRAYTGEVLTVSNRNINEVINYSTQSSKAVIDVSIAYNTDLEKAEAVLKEVAEDLSKRISYLTSEVLVLGVQSLDESAVIYRLVADCEPTMDIPFNREVQRAVKIAFDKNGIEIPFPQLEVHGE